MRGATERPQSVPAPPAGTTAQKPGMVDMTRGYAARAQPRSGKLSMTRQTPSGQGGIDRGHREAAAEVGQLVEGPVEGVLAEVVAIVTCGW